MNLSQTLKNGIQGVRFRVFKYYHIITLFHLPIADFLKRVFLFFLSSQFLSIQES